MTADWQSWRDVDREQGCVFSEKFGLSVRYTCVCLCSAERPGSGWWSSRSRRMQIGHGWASAVEPPPSFVETVERSRSGYLILSAPEAQQARRDSRKTYNNKPAVTLTSRLVSLEIKTIAPETCYIASRPGPVCKIWPLQTQECSAQRMPQVVASIRRVEHLVQCWSFALAADKLITAVQVESS